MDGAWPQTGIVDGFESREWAQVDYLRSVLDRRRTAVVTYDLADPTIELNERSTNPDDAALPADGNFGWQALLHRVDESILDRERMDSEVWGQPWR